MKQIAFTLIRDEQGQDLVEYALIVAAVGLALISTVQPAVAGHRQPVPEHYRRSVQHRHSGGLAPDLEGAPADGFRGTGASRRRGFLAGTRSRLTRLAPDLALVAACVTLFYCLFLFQGYRSLFRDSDAGWHIRTGEPFWPPGLCRAPIPIPSAVPASRGLPGSGCRTWRRRRPTAPRDSPGWPCCMPRRSRRACGFGSGCTGWWRAISSWPPPWLRCCSPPARCTGWPGRT